MAIKHHHASGRCYLQEWHSHRREGKVVSEYVRYLGPCPEHNPKPGVSVLDRTEQAIGLSSCNNSKIGVDSSA